MRGHGNAVGFRCQAQFISLPSACSEYLPLLFLSTEQSPPPRDSEHGGGEAGAGIAASPEEGGCGNGVRRGEEDEEGGD